MSHFWSDFVSGLTPYVPGEQPRMADLIKLNTNENPYPPSPAALTAMKNELGGDAAKLRLYPDPESTSLKAAIAHYFRDLGLNLTQIFVGNGSDEVLAHVFSALLKHDAPLLLPEISYSFYPVYCKLYDIKYRTIPLNARFEIDPYDYTGQNGGIIIANPNAPTGHLLTLDKIRVLLAANPASVVAIDEAYIDFAGETVPTAVSLVSEYPNLLVIRTLSKSHALAGLRVGYAIGHPDLIEALERVKNSFNSYPIDRLAMVGAAAAMADEAYLNETRLAVIKTRERLVETLKSLGFEVLPSAANFIFVSHPHCEAATLAKELRAARIIVRHFNQAGIERFLRITIGTDAQCEALIKALRTILKVA